MIEYDIKKDRQVQEAIFYGKPFKFSYSGLNKLLFSPSSFYNWYILNERKDITSPNLIQGKVIHALLLDNNSFSQKFIISPATLPEGNGKILIDKVFDHYMSVLNDPENAEVDVPGDLSDYRGKILETMVDMNYWQSLTDDKPKKGETTFITGDDKRIAKAITDTTLNYWKFLQLKAGRDLIDQETYDYCVEAAEALRRHTRASELMALFWCEFDNVTVENEIHLEVDSVRSKTFGLHGYLDNVHINHDEKVIYLNDLKTTGKSLGQFKESIEYYSYWLQMAIYHTLVYNHYYDLVKKGYQIKCHFIVIDPYMAIYCFPVTAPTLAQWLYRMDESLDIADYHYTNKKYELPYDFCRGVVEL